MVKTKHLTKEVLLGLTLAGLSCGQTFAATGVVLPGTITNDAVITLGTSEVGITEEGTYEVQNSAKTLSFTNGSGNTGINVFGVTGGKKVVINGNLTASGSNWLASSGSQLAGGDITINGDMTLAANNVGKNASQAAMMSIGSDTATSTMTISGKLSATNKVDTAPESFSLLTVLGPKTTLTVNGGLYMRNQISTGASASGSNSLYANTGATININGDEAYISSISMDPDAITAKRESTINLNTKKTQVIGNLSFIERGSGLTLYPGGTIKAVFDGPDSYWYGDEQNYLPQWDGYAGGTRGTLDFTFKNGAEWCYFGSDYYYNLKVWFLTFKLPVAQAKYVSALTLEDGGIVNLQDADIQNKLASIDGLLAAYPNLATYKHDFVTIGDLKGSNGIFKLDMDVNDKSKSDMIFVESSSAPGQHYVESNLTEADLQTLSSTNKLRFATTAAAASGVSFAYKMNSSENSLWDYKALVGSSAYDAKDSENTLYNARYTGSGNDIENVYGYNFGVNLNTAYANGTNWYLYGLTKTPSVVTKSMLATSGATYDFAIDLDTLNKRQGRTQFLDNTKQDGAWVRYDRRGYGRDSMHNGTTSKMQLGYDYLFAHNSQRLGIAFDYDKGTTGFSKYDGNVESSRRGITIYDTFAGKDGQYLDLVGRYGKLSNDLTTYNSQGTQIKGTYDNHVTSLSAEYGKHINLNKFFVEPQMQLQYAWLSSGGYTTTTGLRSNIKGAGSLIGRLGFRAGQTLPKGEYYFKADALREMRGGQDTILADKSSTLADRIGSRGTWYDVGLGFNYKLGNNALIYVDGEKNFGGDYKGWEANVGFNLNF
jgi:outer membrane autotransporter protein